MAFAHLLLPTRAFARGALLLVAAGLAAHAGCSFPDYAFESDNASAASGGSQTSGGMGGDLSPDTGGAPQEGGSAGAVSEPAPRCDDGKQNGTETDVDCGGVCPGCGITQHCTQASDCATKNCNPDSTKCEASLKLECRCTNCQMTYTTTQTMVFRVRNEGRTPINLKDFKFRYYFKRNADEIAKCADFPGGCSLMKMDEYPLVPEAVGASTYEELTFQSGTADLAPVTGLSGEATITFSSATNGSFDQTDDYSWTAAPDFAPCPQWTAYRVSTRDTLVFGNEPKQ